jgi:hypothetical protein
MTRKALLRFVWYVVVSPAALFLGCYMLASAGSHVAKEDKWTTPIAPCASEFFQEESSAMIDLYRTITFSSRLVLTGNVSYYSHLAAIKLFGSLSN